MSVKYKSLFLLKASGKMLKCIAGGFLFTIHLFLRLALIHISLFYNLKNVAFPGGVLFFWC